VDLIQPSWRPEQKNATSPLPLVETFVASDFDPEVVYPMLWTLPLDLLDPVHQDTASWNGIRIRVGLHYGSGEIQWDPVTLSRDYYGNVVNTAARVEAKASGGQLLVSGDLVAALPETKKHLCIDQGTHELKGIAQPLQLFHTDSVANRPCPDSLLKRCLEEQEKQRGEGLEEEQEARQSLLHLGCWGFPTPRRVPRPSRVGGHYANCPRP
jgi:hypothetical protein